MAKIDDLNASNANLGNVVTTAAQTIKSELETIAAAHTNDDGDALTGSIARINAMADQLTSAMSGVTASASTSTIDTVGSAVSADSVVAVTGTDTIGGIDTVTGATV